MSKVSNFKLAASSIKEVCRVRKLPFVDLIVDFDNSKGIGLKEGILNIGGSNNLGQTQIKIVQLYINNSEEIVGEHLFLDENQEQDFFIHFSTMIRRVMISERKFEEGQLEVPHVIRLYQEPFLWILMKDLICPIYDKELKNIAIMCGTSPKVDGSKYYREGEIENDNFPKEEFIFINYDVQNVAARSAFAFIETLIAYSLNPSEVIEQLFESDLYEKVKGAAYLAFVKDEHVEEFIAIIFKVLDINSTDFPHVKLAQAYDHAQVPNTMQWWYQGLLEKMIEPVRGYEWSTSLNLGRYLEEFWNRVEEIKSKKEQGEGIPYNQLLRLKYKQTADDPQSNEETIQGLLSSQRIW